MRRIELPLWFRDEVAECLGEGLVGVRVLLPGPADITPADGVAACLDADHIWLCQAPDLADPASRAILVHELCHIAQRRHGRRARGAGAPVAALEHQAQAAEACFAEGRRLGPLLPSRGDGPLHWGAAGHYWTTYITGIAVGIAPAQAAQYAFFSQLADQVLELDATAAGERYFTTDITPAAHWRDLAVETGLHSLTGRLAERETAARARILQDNLADAFVGGLAIHAYGDSFAHRQIRNPRWMYRAPWGHFFDVHDADYINLRLGLYRDYVAALHAALRPLGGGRVMEVGRLQKLLSVAGAAFGDVCQSLNLRDAAYQAWPDLRLDPYRPESTDQLGWADFARAYGYRLGTASLDRAIRLAQQWGQASA